MVLITERPEVDGTEGVARALHELARGMGALENDARSRRDHTLASAYRNRQDAYDHAAAIAGAISDAFRARVEASLLTRYKRIADDQAAGVSGGNDLVEKRLLVDLMDELGIRFW